VEAGTNGGARVLVVEDDANCRALVVELLERIGCSTREASSGLEALAMVDAFPPQLVLLEVDVPLVTGYEVCYQVRAQHGSSVRIIFLSGTRVEAMDRVGGLLIGADDYIVKPFDPDELVARVRVQLRAGERGSRRVERRAPSAPAAGKLTNREREVFTLLADGYNQNAIADELVISSKTVGTHIQRMLEKLGVHSRAEAVALAHNEGLLNDVTAHAVLDRTPAG
jgi:DNA-binding NarL/FixJ family response regulator